MVQAIVAQRPGGAEVLDLVEVPSTPLQPDDIRVSVKFAGVNFWDIMQRRGLVPLGDPAIPGVEGVGTVTEVGRVVDDKRVGQRVVWSKVGGSYAREVVGPEASFVTVPDGLSDEAAAGLLMQGVTAQYLAEDTWPLAAGDSAVVHAAAGGVGTLLIQFLKARGVFVIGVVSKEAKRTAAMSAGADEVLLPSERYVDAVRTIVPGGVAAVFDANGGADTLLGIDVLRPRGALVIYGATGGPPPEFDLGRLGAGSFYVTRTAGRDYARTPEEWRGRAAEVLARASAGQLRAIAGGIWPLSEAAAAHRHLESRASVGKLLLDVSK